MANRGPVHRRRVDERQTRQDQVSTPSSDHSSVCEAEEEERARRLFFAFDRDCDGLIDSHEVFRLCQQLNIEDVATEIMAQLRPDGHGRISYQEFSRCRLQATGMLDEERRRDALLAATHPRQTSSSNWPTDSDNSLGAVPDSLDYDSGARDMSPEPCSLYKLMECQDAETYHRMVEAAENYTRQGAPNFLDVANSLHLSALASLRGEIVELSNRLQQLGQEKRALENQLNQHQAETLRLQQEAEERFDQQTSRYEQRISELHKVIAQLRKRLSQPHDSPAVCDNAQYVSSNEACSSKSGHEGDASISGLLEVEDDNSRPPSIADLAPELNAELSRVVSELDSTIEERVPGRHPLANSEAQLVKQKAQQVCDQIEQFSITSTSLPPASGTMASQREGEVKAAQHKNRKLVELLKAREAELSKVKLQSNTIREERDRLRRRVRELQTRVQSLEASTSPIHRQMSPITTTSNSHLYSSYSSQVDRSTYENLAQHASVAKVAELKKLKTGDEERAANVPQVELGNAGLPNTKVAEHLVKSLHECSNVQEIVQAVYECGTELSDSKIKEFEIESERLQSKIDHLKAQNDLTLATLEESKANCDRMTVLTAKYESNSTAHQLAASTSDQIVEAYEVLAMLQDSELKMLLANCQAAGLGSAAFGAQSMEVDGSQEAAKMLQRARVNRKMVENMAKQLLQKAEHGGHQAASPMPWEDLSSASHTASTNSSTGSYIDSEFTKVDEGRIRDLITQLKQERTSIKLSIMELQPVHFDPASQLIDPDAQKLDLENAVLMQELMAIKEDKAELRAQNYMLEKENNSLQLQLSGKQSQEQAYLVQIDHLKSELTEHVQRLCKEATKKDNTETPTPAITLAELRSSTSTDMAQDLGEALKRERKLKQRVSELMLTLEKLSQNSEVRHQQSAEFVNDLKRANSALVNAFEKAKRKYQGKIRKLESQLALVTEKYEAQAAMLKQRIQVLQDEMARISSNETSL